jgi:hypothetical protein
VDFQDRVRGVVLAGEQGGQLDRFHALREPIDRGVEIPRGLFALAGQLQKGLGVLQQGVQLSRGIDVRGQARALLLDGLGPLRVTPDVGSGQLLLEPIEGRAFALDIKGTSAAPRPWTTAR